MIDFRKQLSNPRTNCFVERPSTLPPDFSFCGDLALEGEEECDCGLHYETCSDPCCYPAHIHPADLAENDTAQPCRRNRKHLCLHPFASTWTYGFLGPWIMMVSAASLAAIVLVYDWYHDRRAFTHVTKPKEMIRSETKEQITRRFDASNILFFY